MAVVIPPAQIAGQWQIVAKSFVKINTYMIIEANLSQTEDAISASAQNVLFLDGVQDTTVNDPLFADANGLGGECDEQTLGDVTIDGTLSAGPTLAFTLTDSGRLGTVVTTGSLLLNSGGTAVESGEYTTPPGCGFNLDTGGVTVGSMIQPFAGTFSGTLKQRQRSGYRDFFARPEFQSDHHRHGQRRRVHAYGDSDRRSVPGERHA